jgi:4-amino-4-deoxy-L-arabinose transferase-like glycosyltransferase
MTDTPTIAPSLAVPPPVDGLDRLARSRFAWLVLAAVAAAFALLGYGLPPLDRDESRFAQATVQMLETGDFVDIRFQDEARHNKPVGIYWLQAAAVSVLSDPAAREIWAFRIVSTLGAILAVLAAFWGGRSLVGARAAFIGSALFGATVLMSTEAHIAKTDAMLAGMTTLAVACLARLRMGEGGRWTALLFWFAVGAGILLKGPITPLVAFLTLLVLWLWEGRRAPWARPLVSVTGPLLMALVVVPWLVAVQTATDGAFLVEAVTGDFKPKLTGADEGHHGWPGYHTMLLPLLLFPATIWLIPGLRLGWSAVRNPIGTENANAIRFLVAWIVPTLVVMELTPTKLLHYTLPIYPALCLLIGAAVNRSDRFGWGSALLAGLAATALLTVFFGFRTGGLEVFEGEGLGLPAALAAGVVAVVLGAHWWLLSAGAMRGTSVRLMRVLAVGFLALFLVKWSAPATLFPSTSMARMAEALDGPGPLLSVGHYEPSLVFQTATDTVMLPGSTAAAAAQLGQRALVEDRERAAFEAGLAVRGLWFRPRPDIVVLEAFNYNGGDRVRVIAGNVLPRTGAASPPDALAPTPPPPPARAL